MPVILELRRVRQENCAFEAILDFSQKRARIMGERPWEMSQFLFCCCGKTP